MTKRAPKSTKAEMEHRVKPLLSVSSRTALPVLNTQYAAAEWG